MQKALSLFLLPLFFLVLFNGNAKLCANESASEPLALEIIQELRDYWTLDNLSHWVPEKNREKFIRVMEDYEGNLGELLPKRTKNLYDLSALSEKDFWQPLENVYAKLKTLPNARRDLVVKEFHGFVFSRSIQLLQKELSQNEKNENPKLQEARNILQKKSSDYGMEKEVMGVMEALMKFNSQARLKKWIRNEVKDELILIMEYATAKAGELIPTIAEPYYKKEQLSSEFTHRHSEVYQKLTEWPEPVACAAVSLFHQYLASQLKELD